MKLTASAHTPTLLYELSATALPARTAWHSALQAIWQRLRHGARVLHFVPPGGQRTALHRGLLVLLACRPFFPHIVQHWQVRGLGDWLEREGSPLERWLAHWLLGGSSLAFAPAITSLRDPLWFCTRRAEVLPGGIDDPCADHDRSVQPERARRLEARQRALRGEDAGEVGVFRVLFLAPRWWYADIDSALACLATAASRTPLRFRLTLAGPEFREGQQAEFCARGVGQPLDFATWSSLAERSALFRTHDCLLWPGAAADDDSTPLVLEAMAHGLPVVFGGGGLLDECFPAEYPGRVEHTRLFDQPGAFAEALLCAASEDGRALRAHFLETFVPSRIAERMRAALAEVSLVPAG